MSQLEDLLQQCTVKLSVPNRMGWGTGFFVAPKWILTCAHVVESRGQFIQVRWQDQENWAQAVVERSLSNPYDLALLQVTLPTNANPPCVYLGKEIQSRDNLYLFGYPDQDFPDGCPATFSCEGLTGDKPALIKFDLGQVRPGMSGSPLLNQRTGKVCGIVKFTRGRSLALGGGAIPTYVILQQFPELEELQQKFHRSDRRWRDLYKGTDSHPAFLNQFESLIEDKTKWFVGRTYVFDAIQSFISKNPKGYFTIIGDPGQGKSAILAKYVRDTGCIAYFNMQLQGINQANQFLESVCRQLVARYDLPYDPLSPRATQDGEFLSQLLEEVARKAKGQSIVIAIDGLDEVDSASYRDANILYLPPQLPDGIYFVLTRRRVEVPLTVHVPTRLLSLLDDQYQSASEQDVRTYIQKRIDSSDTLRQQIDVRQESITDFTNKITEQSDKNFMYLYYVIHDIEEGLYKDLDLEHFPQGLQGYYEFHWKRMGMMSSPLPVEKIKIVYILAEVRQPVSTRKICDFSSEDGIKVEQVIKEWKQFLHDLRKNEQIRYSVYHSSFRDFLHRRDILESHPVTLQDVHRRIAEDQAGFWEEFKAKRRGDRYARD